MLAGIILAAGASSRMGHPKALLPARDGRSFLVTLAGAFADAGLHPLVVVVGLHGPLIADAIREARVALQVAVNAHPERGQLSSVITGLEALAGSGCGGAAVIPVDQPLVSVEAVRRLHEAWRVTRAPIVRPEHRGRHGHPVIFDAHLFDELRGADLEVGARAVVQRHRGEILDVAITDPGAYEDIDTPDDYRRLIGPWPERPDDRRGHAAG
ncbi:MAG TPA: nucleotidyltransferase family protein [Vicinamibacterales bacterium]|nr:nucleotidyltransferase family protein [Vicinamibacterales bacterium]